MPFPNPDTQFKPGNPGGPGAPKGGKLTLMLRAFLETEDPKTRRTYGERVVKALVHGAIRGQPAAINQLWDRVEGKVVQPIADATPITLADPFAIPADDDRPEPNAESGLPTEEGS